MSKETNRLLGHSDEADGIEDKFSAIESLENADSAGDVELLIASHSQEDETEAAPYNAFAGEMAEPYRVLVVANYPAGFSESAAELQCHRCLPRAFAR